MLAKSRFHTRLIYGSRSFVKPVSVKQANKQIEIVGAGSFAEKLGLVFSEYGIEFAFVDESQTTPKLSKPVRNVDMLLEKTLEDSYFMLAISDHKHSKKAVARLHDRGVTTRQIVQLSYDSDVLIIDNMLRQDPDLFWCLIARSNEINDLDARFFSDREQYLARKKSKAEALVGFYCLGRGGGYYEHLGTIPEKLSEQYSVVALSDTCASQKYFSEAKNPIDWFLMGQSRMLVTDIPDLVVTAHVYPCSPKHIKKLSLSHTLHDFLIFSQQTIEHISQPDTHYICVPSIASMQMYQNICRQFDIKNNVVLIPGGYPRFDVNMLRYAAMTEQQVLNRKTCTILYSPTLSSLPAQDGTDECYSISQAFEFLSRLLNYNKNITLIVRPHPEDLQLNNIDLAYPRAQAMKKLLRWCAQEGRCFIDDAKSDYMPSFLRADIMITDTSSVAVSFAALTHKPVLFYSLDHEKLSQDFTNSKFIQDRSKVGVLVNQENIIDSVDMMLKQEEGSRRRIEYCKNIVFNPGAANEYLAKNIHYILEDKKHPEWWYALDHINTSTSNVNKVME